MEMLGQHIFIFKILQHISTFIGGIVIVFFLYKQPKQDMPIRKIDYTYWIILLSLTLVIATIKLLITSDCISYGNVIVTLISAGLIAIILSSFYFKRY